MSRRLWRRGVFAVVSVFAASGAIAIAQQNGQQNGIESGQSRQRGEFQRRDVGHDADRTAGRVNVDHFIVKTLTAANNDEIASARLAQQRSTNPDVKKFAMQMIEDHSRFQNRLASFQGEPQRPGIRQPGTGNLDESRPRTPSSAPDRFRSDSAGAQSRFQGEAGQATNRAGQPEVAGQHRFGSRMTKHGDGAVGHVAAARHFVKMMDEAAVLMQQSVIRELSQKEGIQFDRCYMGAQVHDHMWVSAALTVFERNASPQLQAVLQEGLQSTQQHLEHAKALAARLEQSQGNTARLPSQTSPR